MCADDTEQAEQVLNTVWTPEISFWYFVKASTNTAQKMKFSIKDLVTFTEEILNRKLHFLCSVRTR